MLCSQLKSYKQSHWMKPTNVRSPSQCPIIQGAGPRRSNCSQWPQTWTEASQFPTSTLEVPQQREVQCLANWRRLWYPCGTRNLGYAIVSDSHMKEKEEETHIIKTTNRSITKIRRSLSRVLELVFGVPKRNNILGIGFKILPSNKSILKMSWAGPTQFNSKLTLLTGISYLMHSKDQKITVPDIMIRILEFIRKVIAMD